MIDTSFLNELNRFSIALKKKVHSDYQGGRESSYQGGGLTFKDHTKYSLGDDFRKIDWKVYARTDKFFIRRFEEERNMTLHVVIDSSASMDYGEKHTKYDYASMIGLGFAYMALKNNEKFEFSTFAEHLELFRPRKGMSQLMSMLDYLNHKKVKGQSKFRSSLETIRKQIMTKSLVVVISDFLYDVDELKEAFHLFKRSELIVIQVLDETERDLPLYGDLKLKDSESGGLIHTFLGSRLKSRYKQRMEEHNAALRRLCEDEGANFVTVYTDTPIFDAFFAALRL